VSRDIPLCPAPTARPARAAGNQRRDRRHDADAKQNFSRARGRPFAKATDRQPLARPSGTVPLPVNRCAAGLPTRGREKDKEGWGKVDEMGGVYWGKPPSVVMPGLDPGIHSVMSRTTNAYQIGGRPICIRHPRDRRGRSSSGMDARIKSGHDEGRGSKHSPSLAISGTWPLAKTPKSLSLPQGREGSLKRSSAAPPPGPARRSRHRARWSQARRFRRRRRLSGTGSPVRG
jgi:hypothetical protein